VSPRRNVERAADEFRERAGQIEPIVAGAAVAAVVVGVGVVILFLVRRRRR
jgi:hypothetical protein